METQVLQSQLETNVLMKEKKIHGSFTGKEISWIYSKLIEENKKISDSVKVFGIPCVVFLIAFFVVYFIYGHSETVIYTGCAFIIFLFPLLMYVLYKKRKTIVIERLSAIMFIFDTLSPDKNYDFRVNINADLSKIEKRKNKKPLKNGFRIPLISGKKRLYSSELLTMELKHQNGINYNISLKEDLVVFRAGILSYFMKSFHKTWFINAEYSGNISGVFNNAESFEKDNYTIVWDKTQFPQKIEGQLIILPYKWEMTEEEFLVFEEGLTVLLKGNIA